MDVVAKSLLIVDDNITFCAVLSQAMQKRGLKVDVAHDLAEVRQKVEETRFDYAVVDLKLARDSGLTVLKHLHQISSTTRSVMLTGYASISTAIESIRMGAVHYLPKPANADEILAALNKMEAGDELAPISNEPLPLSQLEWEHIHRILLEHNGNITATAQALNMHRRSLQRKLAKHSPLSKENQTK